MCAKERKWAQNKECKRRQKGAKGHKKKSAKERLCVKIANSQVYNNQVWELPIHSAISFCDFSAVRVRDGETTIKINFSLFEGGGGGLGGREENRPKHCFFRGKRHDNKILKMQIVLSRNFVVIAQAPKELRLQFVIWKRSNLRCDFLGCYEGGRGGFRARSLRGSTHLRVQAETSAVLSFKWKMDGSPLQEKNWEHSGREGIRKFPRFPNLGHFPPRKIAKFTLKFWPVRVHEKPSFRYVPSTFFAS